MENLTPLQRRILEYMLEHPEILDKLIERLSEESEIFEDNEPGKEPDKE